MVTEEDVKLRRLADDLTEAQHALKVIFWSPIYTCWFQDALRLRDVVSAFASHVPQRNLCWQPVMWLDVPLHFRECKRSMPGQSRMPARSKRSWRSYQRWRHS